MGNKRDKQLEAAELTRRINELYDEIDKLTKEKDAIDNINLTKDEKKVIKSVGVRFSNITCLEDFDYVDKEIEGEIKSIQYEIDDLKNATKDLAVMQKLRKSLQKIKKDVIKRSE